MLLFKVKGFTNVKLRKLGNNYPDLFLKFRRDKWLKKVIKKIRKNDLEKKSENSRGIVVGRLIVPVSLYRNQKII